MVDDCPIPHPDQSDDYHFLRTGAESESGALPADKKPAHLAGGDCGAMWPLPTDIDTWLEPLQQWDRWSALAVRIDGPADAKLPKTLRSSLKQLLTGISADHDGLWFDWQAYGYGLVLPRSDARAATLAARSLQLELARRYVQTVSIGIAEYPLHCFDQRQSLVNACKALEHAAFFGPDTCTIFDAVSLNISGDRCYQSQNLDGAIQEYRHALALDDANLNVRNSLGVCLAEKGDLDAARTEFETVCRLQCSDAMALFNIGLIDLRQGRSEQARIHLEKAYAADPDTYEVPFQLGRLCFKQNQAEQALHYLQAALKIRNNHAPLHALLGQCFDRLGRVAESVAALKKAIKLNPNDADSLSNLGVIYARKGENIDICITLCRQSVLIAPQNSLYRYRLARLYHDSGQWEQALAQYEQAVELGHDAVEPAAEIRRRLCAGRDGKVRCA